MARPAPRKCYYELLELEVGPATTDTDVKKAYRRLALIHHPDKSERAAWCSA